MIQMLQRFQRHQVEELRVGNPNSFRIYPRVLHRMGTENFGALASEHQVHRLWVDFTTFGHPATPMDNVTTAESKPILQMIANSSRLNQLMIFSTDSTDVNEVSLIRKILTSAAESLSINELHLKHTVPIAELVSLIQANSALRTLVILGYPDDKHVRYLRSTNGSNEALKTLFQRQHSNVEKLELDRYWILGFALRHLCESFR